MNKRLLSLAVASLVCAGVAEAKFYIGIEGGYTGAAYDSKDHDLKVNSSYFVTPGSNTLENTFKDITYSDGTNTYKADPWMGFNVAVTAGTEHFFASNYLGVRWGASAGFTEIMRDRKKTSNIQNTFTDTLGTIDAGLSFDLIINLINRGGFSFGVFGGVEGDYHYLVISDVEDSAKSTTTSYLNGANRHSLDVAGRVGLSTLIGRHHRFDLTAKLPIGYVAAGDDNKVQISGGMPVRTSFNFGYKYVF